MSAVRTALYALLAADDTLTDLLATATSIYHQVAPVEAAHPLVVFNRQSGTRVQAFGGSVLSPEVWLVKAVDRSLSATVAEAIDARVATLLEGASLTITGSTLRYLRREADVQFLEQDGQDIYQHAGGLYRLIHSPN